jgi:hypothetical protein
MRPDTFEQVEVPQRHPRPRGEIPAAWHGSAG